MKRLNLGKVKNIFLAVFPLLVGWDRGVAYALEQLVVEKVEVNSDSTVDSTFLEAILGLEKNKPLTREDLDTILVAAESKLQALGFFSAIEFRIRKGSAPGRVIVIVQLDTSTYYLGFKTELYRQRNVPGYGESDKDGSKSNLYGGTRNFLGKGIKLDLDVSYEDMSDISTVRGVKAEGDNTESALFATGYIPHSIILPFVDLGMGAYYALSSSTGSFQSLSSKNQVDATGEVRTYLVTTGFRQGLFTATGLGVRYGVDVDSDARSQVISTGQTTRSKSKSTYWGSAAGLQLKFSEKTGLALVESGFKVFADYTRTTSPEVTPPQVNFSGEYTYYHQSRHAFTPQVRLLYDWDNDSNLVRYYDASFLYQWSPRRDLVLGIEHGIHDVYGGADPYVISLYPEKRLRISFDYVTANFSIGIAFLYGPRGARDSVGDLSDLTRSDL